MTTTVATMSAAVLVEPETVQLECVSVPEPRRHEVLVRVEGCGVCGSSLPIWEGRPWFDYPLAPGEPGHEGWGIVERTGEAVDELEPGARVAFLSARAFAELDVAAAAHCVVLPRELDGMPVPGEALGCAVNVFRRSRIRAGERVAIVGMGFLGSLVAQLCRGASTEVVCVRRGTELEGPFARVIEAAGTQAALDTASQLVGEGGVLVIAGFHQDGLRTVDLQSWNWRGIDVVNAHERDPRVVLDGVNKAVQLIATGRLDPSPLYTHAFPLARAADAFRAALTRPPGFTKALVLQ
ncbi:MAG: alcohol dehydrogenase catalytic domain-containing protein [Gaiellaceae bacterium]